MTTTTSSPVTDAPHCTIVERTASYVSYIETIPGYPHMQTRPDGLEKEMVDGPVQVLRYATTSGYMGRQA